MSLPLEKIRLLTSNCIGQDENQPQLQAAVILSKSSTVTAQIAQIISRSCTFFNLLLSFLLNSRRAIFAKRLLSPPVPATTMVPYLKILPRIA